MMKHIVMMTGAMASLLVLAGCKDKIGPAAAGPEAEKADDGGPTVFEALGAGPSSTPTGDCTGGTRIGEVITMTLGQDAIRQLGGKNGEITRTVKKGTAPDNSLPDLAGTPLYPTNLDLRAGTGGVDPGTRNYVEINVTLEPPKAGTKRSLIFLRMDSRSPIGPNDPATAAITVPSAAVQQFCMLSPTISRSVDGTETVRLGSKLVPGAASSFNIGVQVYNLRNGRLSTPVYIDPNMRNEG